MPCLFRSALPLRRWVSVDADVFAEDVVALEHPRVCGVRGIKCNFRQAQEAGIRYLERRAEVEVIDLSMPVQVGNTDAEHCT
jgi:hypothetical protein